MKIGKFDTQGYVGLNPIGASLAPNNSIFLDTSDSTMKQKSSSGNVSSMGTAENSTPADNTFDGIKTTLVCHESIAQGDVCYINADGEAQLAQANVIANASAVVLATEGGSASDTKIFLVQGFARDDSWTALTAGSFVYLSAATPGKMTNTAPSATNNVIQILGWAKTTKLIFFNPSLSQAEHA